MAAQFPDTAIVPYIIPGRTGTALAVEDLAILAHDYPNISTVKEATGDLERMGRTRALLGTGFSIMSGDDDLTFKMMSEPSIKANGVISVASNFAPAAVRKMVDLTLSGDAEAARKAMSAVEPLLGVITVKVDNERVLHSGQKATVNDRYRNPLPVKTLHDRIGNAFGTRKAAIG